MRAQGPLPARDVKFSERTGPEPWKMKTKLRYRVAYNELSRFTDPRASVLSLENRTWERRSCMTRIAVVVSVKEPDSIFHYSYATLGNVQLVPMGEQVMNVDCLEDSL